MPAILSERRPRTRISSLSWPEGRRAGGKRIDETMLYVHVAEAYPRDLPEVVINAGNGIADPDRRVLAMLGARGSHVAADDTSSNETVGRSVA